MSSSPPSSSSPQISYKNSTGEEKNQPHQEPTSSRSLGVEKSSWYLGLCTRRDLFISVGFLNFCGGLGYPILSLKGWLNIFYIDNLMTGLRSQRWLVFMCLLDSNPGFACQLDLLSFSFKGFLITEIAYFWTENGFRVMKTYFFEKQIKLLYQIRKGVNSQLQTPINKKVRAKTRWGWFFSSPGLFARASCCLAVSSK